MQFAKPREQFMDVFLCDTNASVDDVHDQQALDVVVAGPDFDLTALSELQGVLHQVDHDLLEASIITVKLGQSHNRADALQQDDRVFFARHLQTLTVFVRDADIFGVCLRCKDFNDEHDGFCRVKNAISEPENTVFELPQVKQVVHKGLHQVGLRKYQLAVLDRLCPFWRVFGIAIHNELEEVED